jgi:anti-sigma regulatory factor (Ser/Thr protein kinase)
MTMSFSNQSCSEIADSSHVGAARRKAAELAGEAGLDETACGKVGIIVNELANNILKHAGRGTLLLQRIGVDGAGVEVVAIDAGSGMVDLEKCLADGYSTSGTAGNGLGAVRRLSDEFDIWSAPSGTVVLSRVFRDAADRSADGIGGVCVALKGELVCGDAWAVRRNDADVFVLVVDGLGHGAPAAEAAESALAIFRKDQTSGTRQLLEQMHRTMQTTRGAAVAIAKVVQDTQQVNYCAVGNIAGRLQHADGSRGLLSNNGIVGGQFRRMEEIAYPWNGPAQIILHSDGLQSRWALENYPGLMARHPAIIAAVLFRDFSRGRDDATVVVVKLPAANDP